MLHVANEAPGRSLPKKEFASTHSLGFARHTASPAGCAHLCLGVGAEFHLHGQASHGALKHVQCLASIASGFARGRDSRRASSARVIRGTDTRIGKEFEHGLSEAAGQAWQLGSRQLATAQHGLRRPRLHQTGQRHAGSGLDRQASQAARTRPGADTGATPTERGACRSSITIAAASHTVECRHGSCCDPLCKS